MSGVKIYATVAAFLLIGLAHSCLGACPEGSSIIQQSAQGEWCVFCPNGKAATQSFTSAGVSCTCGKDDCSVTLAGKPSTLSAYENAIKVSSSSSPVQEVQETVSNTAEEVSETTSSSSSGSTATTTTTTTETTSSHGVMAVASVMAIMMVALVA